MRVFDKPSTPNKLVKLEVCDSDEHPHNDRQLEIVCNIFNFMVKNGEYKNIRDIGSFIITEDEDVMCRFWEVFRELYPNEKYRKLMFCFDCMFFYVDLDS